MEASGKVKAEGYGEAVIVATYLRQSALPESSFRSPFRSVPRRQAEQQDRRAGVCQIEEAGHSPLGALLRTRSFSAASIWM